MKKKIISILSAAVLAFPLFQFSADAAGQLPFTLTAPEHIAITYLNGNDSLTTCQLTWSQNTSMSEWCTRMANSETHNDAVKELETMGYSELSYTAQMDWSIDSTEDWHYNAYWDTDGWDSDNVKRLGEWAYTYFQGGADITNDEWVFRDMGDISDPEDMTWYGCHTEGNDYLGWKDVLKEGQYIVVNTEDGGQHAQFDLVNHTVNVRMRWLVTATKLEPAADGSADQVMIGSEWSQIASLGKDAASSVSVGAGDIAAPVIRDLHYTAAEFNGFPVIAFYLDVPDTLSNALVKAQANGGSISLRTEARVPDGEWVELQGDWTVKSGEIQTKLQMLAENAKNVTNGTPIELRCRYDCEPGGETAGFSTEFSNVLTISAEAMQISSETAPAETAAAASTTKTANAPSTQQKALSWLWILLLIVAVIVLLIIIFLLTRRNKEDKK